MSQSHKVLRQRGKVVAHRRRDAVTHHEAHEGPTQFRHEPAQQSHCRSELRVCLHPLHQVALRLLEDLTTACDHGFDDLQQQLATGPGHLVGEGHGLAEEVRAGAAELQRCGLGAACGRHHLGRSPDQRILVQAALADQLRAVLPPAGRGLLLRPEAGAGVLQVKPSRAGAQRQDGGRLMGLGGLAGGIQDHVGVHQHARGE
mmetsp:Transcript_64893/g.154910  ORF Transcript_64893/g.154910 Transcript_64893/m.154910 type:complete len:202 (+) Transcript_64893:1441-2046(+)